MNQQLVQVRKEEFLEMFRLGILHGNDRNKKCWNITSKQKKGKRKKRYVSEYEYKKYQEYLKS